MIIHGDAELFVTYHSKSYLLWCARVKSNFAIIFVKTNFYFLVMAADKSRHDDGTKVIRTANPQDCPLQI